MDLKVGANGEIQCIYSELIDLASLVALTIQRASYVEPNAQGQWTANLSPVGGPILGPFPLRSEALSAEAEWLRLHWIG